MTERGGSRADGEGRGSPDLSRILLGYQRKIYYDRSPLTIIAKSRRIGATFTIAAREVMCAATYRKFGGCDSHYSSTSQRLGRRFMRDAAKWAIWWARQMAPLGVKVLNSESDVQKDRIEFASGNVLQAVPSNPEAWRGEGGRVCIDEAAFHQDLEAILAAAQAVPDWGGAVTLVSTHNGEENPFNLFFEEVRRGDRPGTAMRITIHDALADGLERRKCQLRRERWTPAHDAAFIEAKRHQVGYEQEYEVIPSGGAARYISRDLAEEACVDLRRKLTFSCADGWERRSDREREEHLEKFMSELRPALAAESDAFAGLGGDVGRSANGDLSVFTLLRYEESTQRRRGLVVELRGAPFAEQWAILMAIGDAPRRLIGGGIDKVGLGAALAERAAERWRGRVQAVALTPNWYIAEFPKLRHALEEGQMLLPDDRDVREDLLLVRYSDGRAYLPDERTKGLDGKMRHGDSAISVCLANACLPIPRRNIPDPFSRRPSRKRRSFG